MYTTDNSLTNMLNMCLYHYLIYNMKEYLILHWSMFSIFIDDFQTLNVLFANNY